MYFKSLQAHLSCSLRSCWIFFRIFQFFFQIVKHKIETVFLYQKQQVRQCIPMMTLAQIFAVSIIAWPVETEIEQGIKESHLEVCGACMKRNTAAAYHNTNQKKSLIKHPVQVAKCRLHLQSCIFFHTFKQHKVQCNTPEYSIHILVMCCFHSGINAF